MSIETVLTCPLGHKCEEARDGKLYRCMWYKHLSGVNPNTGIALDEHDCAIGWMPILLIENSQQQKSTGAAVESFRNEVVKAQQSVITFQPNPKFKEIE
jgi:hypothetical protein